MKIPRDAARPKLEDLQAWQDELSGLPFQPDEEECLNNIVDQATSFRNHITHLMNPMMSTPDELSVQRFYLRKIEGADVLLTDETNFLRQELHRWAPVAPEPPPKLEHSLSTRKPRPTKQQKMMKEMGLTNPDDLPVHLRTKKVARKNSDAPAKDGKPAVPGQAAAAENSRSHTPPGDPPAFRVGNPPAQGASVPGSRRESAVEGFGYATGGRFNDDDNNMFASASSSNLAGPTGGFMQSSTSPTETSPAIDPALFDPGSTSPTLQQTGHKRNISDAGPAPSFSGLGEGSQEEPGYFASMAGEALGLTSAVDGEFGNASVEGDTESKGKVEDGIDEFLA